MKTFTFLLFVLLNIIHSAHSQSTLPFPPEREVQFVRISYLDKATGLISFQQKTNLKIDLWPGSTVDFTGSQLFSSKTGDLYSNLGVEVLSKNLFNIVGNVFETQFSIDASKMVLLKRYDEGQIKPLTVDIYDNLTDKVVNTYTFNISIDSDYSVSRDGNVVAIENSLHELTIYKLIDQEYIEVYKSEPYPELGSIIISKDAKRIFARLTVAANEFQWVYVDFNDGVWSKESQIEIPVLEIEGSKLLLEVIGVTDSGNTIILKTKDNGNDTNYHHLVQLKLVDGLWSALEYVGSYEYRKWPSNGVEVKYSDDGRVITVKQTKNYTDDYGPYSYDVNVFIKNEKDVWIKNGINQDGIEIAYEVLLSGDGLKLFWTPYFDVSSTDIDANQFR